ncbi:MAG: NYN domain-containing protein [Anaerolineales bacterium]|nr:NYN domain-containing protein [Anaerolineales bacterium]
MPFIFDGHNLIGKMPGLRLDDPDDEQKLVMLLRAYLRRVRKKGTVVFDQGTFAELPSLSNRELTVRFARPPRTADDVILELVRQERDPRGLTVVTSDRRVSELARQAGAVVQDAAAFVKGMLAAPARPAEKERGLTPAEVEEWEQEFKNRRS